MRPIGPTRAVAYSLIGRTSSEPPFALVVAGRRPAIIAAAINNPIAIFLFFMAFLSWQVRV
jgi:hypothetical protein